MDWKRVRGENHQLAILCLQTGSQGWCSAGFFLPVSNQFWALMVPGGSLWAGLQLNLLYANSLRYPRMCS